MQRLLESSGIQKTTILQSGVQLKSLNFSRKIIEKGLDEKRVGNEGRKMEKKEKRASQLLKAEQTENPHGKCLS